MARWLLPLAAAAGLTFIASALEVKHLTRPFSLKGATALRIEVPEGKVEVHPFAGPTVDVDMRLECLGDLETCKPEAQEISILGRAQGDTLNLGFSGPDALGEKKILRWNGVFFRSRVTKAARKEAKRRHAYKWRITVDLDVHSPPSIPVELFLGKGAAIFHDVSADTRVTIGEGVAQIQLAESKVGSVELRGDRVTLKGPRGRMGQGRKKISWAEGQGDVDIVIEVDKGRAEVQLY